MKELPNILLVDDIASNLIYLRIILKGIEANIIEAESGKEALEKTEGHPLSLAILDVQMSGMNGYELAIEINKNRITDSVPIIFLTAAFPNNDQIIAGYEAGAVDYIIKPLSRKILISKVHIFLQLFRQKRQIIENHEELKRSEIKIQKANEQMVLLNRHLINAREDERAAIALMIHDELGQALTALKIDLGWMREKVETELFSQKLDTMIATTKDTIKKVQRISSELHPKLLTDLGLADAIEWYCGEQRERTGLNFELSLQDTHHADFQKDLALFRILQEALTNVLRHAQASKVSIKISCEPSGTFMTIVDDGVGIDPEILKNSGSMGLFSMRERARQCSGTLKMERHSPAGTKLSVFIPYENDPIK
ncbi:MAG TPA: response regulator [Prolixibacteraceae bacterium]|nr:response regulator [Prolixibacteraceae bacterium]